MELTIEGAIDVALREEYCTAEEAGSLLEELAILRRTAAALEDASALLIVLNHRGIAGAATAAWATRTLDELGALCAARAGAADHA